MTSSTVCISSSREWVCGGASISGFCSSWCGSILNIEILYELGPGLDKVFTQFYLYPHQLVEDSIGLFPVLYPNLHQHPILGVHGGVPELFGIHFTQALIALLFDKTSPFILLPTVFTRALTFDLT